MKQLSTLLIAVFLFTAITPTKAQVNTQDSLALVDLYDSTGGANWTIHTNWLTSAPVSSWYGITVSGGRVTEIVLHRDSLGYSVTNNLKGLIPSSLGNLTSLITLDLSSNRLSGYIPSSFGMLTNIASLILNSNQLSGTISWLGNLTNLIDLELNDNNLSDSIPSSIGNLTKLTNLELANNNLSNVIPSSLGNLIKLAYLVLNNNQLNGTIPSSLGNLDNLQVLFLQNNNFTFGGMEGIVKISGGSFYGTSYNNYAPQATIPLYNNNNVLSVSVGGTPSNDTFKWYKDSVLVATKVGDSTYTATANGNYWVVATNSVATELILYSDTITITSLPIKAINLQAKETHGQVLLQWQTIDEVNTASFTIQHSTDGATFSNVGSKEAVGSGNNGYSFSPPAPIKEVTYYRIKAIDKDGSFSYSNVASVQFTVNSNQLTVYPNPSRDNVTISGSHIASVQVIDNSGRIVKVVSLKDATNPTIKTNDLAAGVYYLHIKTTDGGERVVSFVKNSY